MTSEPYTRDEEERVAEALRGGGDPPCPRCGAGLSRQEVPPKDGVPYVRTRLWLACAGCGRSLVLDRRRIERGP